MNSHRINWMGMGGIESTSMSLTTFRDTVDLSAGALRNKDYQQRRRVAAVIRERLHVIKADLGLAPPIAAPQDTSEEGNDDEDLTKTPQFHEGDSELDSEEAARELARTQSIVDSLSLTSKLDRMQGHMYAFGVPSYFNGSLHTSYAELKAYHEEVVEEVRKRFQDETEKKKQQQPQDTTNKTAAPPPTAATEATESEEVLFEKYLAAAVVLENDYPLLFADAAQHTGKLEIGGIVKKALSQDELTDVEIKAMCENYGEAAAALAESFKKLPTVVEVADGISAAYRAVDEPNEVQ